MTGVVEGGGPESAPHRVSFVPIDQSTLRQAFGRFPTGVAAVCALADGEPIGMAASSFTSVSLDPPLVLLCVAHTSTTWPRLATREHLGLSVLGEGHEDAGRALAAKGVDRFAGIEWEATPAGAVLVHGASAWFECVVHDVVRGGDHDVVLLRVDALRVFPEVPPLVFHASQFRRLAG